MNPALMISALPATSSSCGRVSSVARSTSTAEGSWNAPTRFLPAAVLTPVFPPTAASTIASSVVGTWTTRTPRIQVAATKPARSVAAPPPSEMTTSERVSPTRPQTSQQKPATARFLPSSASGISTRWAVDACVGERAAHLFRGLGEGGLVDEHRVGGAEVRDGGGQLGAHVAADQHG